MGTSHCPRRFLNSEPESVKEGVRIFGTLNVCSELALHYLGHLSPQIDQHGFPQGTTSSTPSAASMVPKPNPTTTWGTDQDDGSCSMSGQLPCLSLGVTVLRFHESQLCSEHNLQAEKGVVALHEAVSCMLENRPKEERAVTGSTGKILTRLQIHKAPSSDIDTRHAMKKQI